MPEILAAAGAEAALAPTVAAATIPEIAATGAMGSMTGGMELAGLTNAAVPSIFNPATVGGLAESMAASQYGGLGLQGIQGLAQGMGAGLPYGVDEQLAQINANPTDLNQFPQYDDVAELDGTTLSEKANPYDALNDISKTDADRIAASNKIMQGNPITGQSVWGDLKTLADKPNLANIKAFANENQKQR